MDIEISRNTETSQEILTHIFSVFYQIEADFWSES